MLYCRTCKTEKSPEAFNKGEIENPLFTSAGNPSRVCRDCSRAASKKFRDANREKVYAWQKAWVLKNPDKVAARTRKYLDKGIEKRAIARALYLKENPPLTKEQLLANDRESKKRWAERNKDSQAARVASRRAQKHNATPAWANKFFITEAYRLAKLREKMTGFKWHVDHIIPLKHKLVCGLHVEYNLQVIPATENHRKSNRFISE